MTRKTTSIKSVAHTATSAIAHTTTRPPIDKQLFLLKSEPDDFSIDDLAQAGNSAGWEGVRNAQAANILRSMHVGDWALFYHRCPLCPATCTHTTHASQQLQGQGHRRHRRGRSGSLPRRHRVGSQQQVL